MSWTQSEKDTLVKLYPSYSDKELCDLLHKTPGQINSSHIDNWE